MNATTETTITAADVREGDVITWVAPASPTSWAMDDVTSYKVTAAGPDAQYPGNVLIRGEGRSLLRLAPERAVRVVRDEARSTETKIADMLVGQHVTIPTVSSGTHTGILVAVRPLGEYAPAGDFIATIQYDDGTQQEVRSSRNYSGWVNHDVPAERIVEVPAAAIRPGHVLVDIDGGRDIVVRFRATADGYAADVRDVKTGEPDHDIPFGPDAVVSIAV